MSSKHTEGTLKCLVDTLRENCHLVTGTVVEGNV